MNTSDQNIIWRNIARRISIIAAVFCSIVLLGLTANTIRSRMYDPIDAPRFDQMLSSLNRNPHDEALRAKVRAMDQQIRSIYFNNRHFALTGLYLLACGVAVLLLSEKVRKSFEPYTTEPNNELIREYVSSIKTGRSSLMATGFIFAGILLTLSVLSRHDATAEYVRYAMSHSPASDATVTGMHIGEQAISGNTATEQTQTAALSNTQPDAGINLTPVGPPTPSGGSLDTGSMNQTPPQPVVTPPVNKLPLPAIGASNTKLKPAAIMHPSPTLQAAMLTYFHPPAWSGQWPMYRGPGGDGVADKSTISPACKVLWKTEIDLPGKNSPIVWGDKLFLSGATADTRAVYCYDAQTGKLNWKKAIPMTQGIVNPRVSNDTGYAPSTLATDGKHVAAIFVNGDICAFDFNGELQWSRNMGPIENTYGHASSLTLYGSGILVQYDQGTDPAAGKSNLYALDINTGKTVWEVKRPVQNSWSTPTLVKSGTTDQLITCANPWVISYDPKTGNEFWRAQCLGGDVAPSAAIGKQFVYTCNLGASLSAIKPYATGDISKTGIAWTSTESLPDITSPLAIDDYLFLAATDGTLSCLNATTGKKLWDHRYDPGLRSSPIAVGKYVIVTDMKGGLHLLTTSNSFKEAHNIAIKDDIEATPAAANNRLYIRSASSLYCIGDSN